MASHNLRSSLTLSSLMDDTNSALPRVFLEPFLPSMLRSSGPRSAMSSGHWPIGFHTCVSWCNLVPATVDSASANRSFGEAALFLARAPDRHRQGKRTDAHSPPTTLLPLPKRLGCRRCSKQGRLNGPQLNAGPSAQCMAVLLNAIPVQHRASSAQHGALSAERRAPSAQCNAPSAQCRAPSSLRWRLPWHVCSQLEPPTW